MHCCLLFDSMCKNWDRKFGNFRGWLIFVLVADYKNGAYKLFPIQCRGGAVWCLTLGSFAFYIGSLLCFLRGQHEISKEKIEHEVIKVRKESKVGVRG